MTFAITLLAGETWVARWVVEGDAFERHLAPSPGAGLGGVDWLQIEGSADGVPFRFPVVPGSLEDEANGFLHPTLRLAWKTRCLVAPKSFLDVVVRFQLRQGKLWLNQFTFAAPGPGAPAPALPFPDTRLQDLSFDLVLVTSAEHYYTIGWATPEPKALARLGVVTPLKEKIQYGNPPLVPDWTTIVKLDFSGFVFRVAVPLARVPQRLSPLGVTMPAADIPAQPAWYTLIIIQRPARKNPGLEGGWHFILDVLLPGSMARRAWNDGIVARYLASLHTIRDGAPISFLPSLLGQAAAGDSSWHARLSFHDLSKVSVLKEADFAIRDPESSPVPQKVQVVLRDVIPVAAHLVRADFGGALTHGGAPLSAHLRVEPPAAVPPKDDESKRLPARPGFVFDVVHHVTKEAAGTQRVRMGALDLRFPAVPDEPGPIEAEMGAGGIQAALRSRTANGAGDDLLDVVRVSMPDLLLQARSALPRAQDAVPGEEYVEEGKSPALDQAGLDVEPPIVIPLQGGVGRPCLFRIEEQALEGDSQTIRAYLLGQAPGSVRLLVLDAQPFLVALVEADLDAGAAGAGVTTEFANWDNRATSGDWNLILAERKYQLVLPPQALGETMHRRHGDGDVVLDPDTGEPKPLAFRLSGVTVAELESSYWEQRYVSAVWNTRRNLVTSEAAVGQRDPGPSIAGLHFELLYGVRGSVANPALRLSEIFARLGRPAPVRLAPPRWLDAAGGSLWRRRQRLWRDDVIRLRHRPAVLEPWWPRERVASVEASGSVKERARPAMLIDQTHGLRFALRHSRTNPQATPDLAYPLPNPDVLASNAPNSPTGLKGGFPWAFESNRIYRALWSRPLSTSGELADPYFSALGGWGRQVARFDNDRTAIISVTEMGRVSSLTIERIGCVGVMRNKAKHVIVYRRTVAPSAQFASQQHPFLGIPMLRKYAEYVELLEAERSFAGKDATERQAGPVLAYRFPDGSPPRIRVDSLWGQDMPDGWKIPLWLPGAEPAPVYPRPRSDFMMAAAAPGSPVAAPNIEPEKLWFYTSTAPELGADTEAWPTVESVDFDRIVRPQDPVNGEPPDDPANFGKDDPLVPYQDGLGPFTWAITPPQPVNMVTGRAGGAASSLLRTVTLMRGAPPVEEHAHPAWAASRGLSDELGNLVQPLRAWAVPAPDWTQLDGVFKQAGTAAGEIGTKAGALLTLLDPDLGKACGSMQGALTAAADMLRANAEGFVKGLGASVDAEFAKLQLFGDLLPQRPAILRAWHQARRGLVSSLDFARGQLARAIEEATSQPLAVLDGAKDDVVALRDELVAIIADMGSGPEAAIAKARKAIEARLPALLTWVETAEKKLLAVTTPEWLGRRAKALAAELGSLSTRVKPTLDRLLTDLQRVIADRELAQATVRAGAANLLRQLDAAKDRLGRAGDDLEDHVRTVGALPLEGSLDEIDKILATYPDWTEATLAAQAHCKSVLDHLATEVAGHLHKLNDALPKANAFCNVFFGESASSHALCKQFARAAGRQFQAFRTQVEAETAALVIDLHEMVTVFWDRLEEEYQQDLGDVLAEVQARWTREATLIRAGLRYTRSGIAAAFDQAAAAVDVAADLADDEIEKIVDAVLALNAEPLDDFKAAAVKAIEAGRDEALKALNTAAEALGRVAAAWSGGKLDALRLRVRMAREDVAATTRAVLDDLAMIDVPAAVDAFKGRVSSRLEDLRDAVRQAAGAVQSRIAQVKADAEGLVKTDVEDAVEVALTRVDRILAVAPDWAALRAQSAVVLGQLAALANTGLAGHLDAIARQIDGLDGFCQSLLSSVADLERLVTRLFDKQKLKDLEEALKKLPPVGNEIARAVDGLLGRFGRDLQELLNQVRVPMPSLPLDGLGDAALRVLRAFGDPPRVPQLDFNLPACRFDFFEWVPRVDLDPGFRLDLPDIKLSRIAGFLNRIGGTNGLSNTLDPLNLCVPFHRLGVDFTPFSLDQFDISAVFKKFAGLNLAGLFEGIKLPKGAGDGVKITHGLDPQARTGWAQADIDFPLGKPVEIFSIAGLVLTLTGGGFHGTLRIEGGAKQAPRTTFRGRIDGNWELRVGSYPVAMLVGCALTFDQSGRVDFDVRPERIRLQQALAFINDLMTPFQDPGQGLSFSFGPEGATVRLDLPLPDIQAGAFGIANLSIGFYLALLLKDTFTIATGVTLARRQRPFTLTIFILGGAGYLDLRAEYAPSSSTVACSLEVGVYASASLAIALGPIRGGVYAYFGINIHYRTAGNQGSQLRISLVLLFVGQVSLLGFLSVSLYLGLEGEYGQGGRLVGRGYVCYSIRLGPFWKIEVRAGVEYVYGNPSSLPAGDLTDYDAAAGTYYDMFAD